MQTLELALIHKILRHQVGQKVMRSTRGSEKGEIVRGISAGNEGTW